MLVFLFLTCEMAFFSLLVGGYMHSFGLGLVILGGSGVIAYPLFQYFYNLYPFIWIVVLLGSLATLLWASFIDYFLDTNFMAVLFSIVMGVFLYFINYFFIKKNNSLMV